MGLYPQRASSDRRLARLLAYACGLGLGLASPSGAAPLNPSFETGDTSNWTTSGDVTVVTSSFGVTPTDGTYQILLTTGTGSTTASTLESDMGLASGFLDARIADIVPASNGTTVVEGSAFQQSFTANAGDFISFDWNFLTNEKREEADETDFVWYSLSSVADGVLASTTLPKSQWIAFLPTTFKWETGYQTSAFALPSTGSYTITVGVVDVNDGDKDSGAVFDNFKVDSPEPNTFLLLAFGLVGLAWSSNRKNLAQRRPRG